MVTEPNDTTNNGTRSVPDKRRIYGLLPCVSKNLVDVIKIGCSPISGLY